MPSINSLMSPPETRPLDSFTPPPKGQVIGSTPLHDPFVVENNTLPPILNKTSPKTPAMRVLPSPPVSPWIRHKEKDGTAQNNEGVGFKGAGAPGDILLYPKGGDDEDIANQPLFPSSPERLLAEQIVSRHMASQMSRFDKKVNRPTRDEYLLALSCVSNIGRSYNHNPGAYLKRTRDETDEQYWKAKRICAGPGVTPVMIAPRPTATVRVRKANANTNGTPKQTKAVRARRATKASPRERLINSPNTGRSATPEVRASPVKRPDDVDFNALADYSPPISTLPTGNAKIFKIEWQSNNPLNLSVDPNRHLLHEAELNLASTLRLTCATYLCSKRRIFEARLNALRIGKEFRKTDAQQACKIDVNKASKLWTAYEKVGWFQKGYFEQYL